VALVDTLLGFLEHRHWEPVTLASGEHQLEVNQVHGMIEAGFILWRCLPNGTRELVTSGHTRDGELLGKDGEILTLPDDVAETIEEILKSG
jgi:hypothetical protein